MTATAASSLDLELYDVDFTDDLGPQHTVVTAICHDDAADQIADLHQARVEATTRRRDGDHVDHTLAAIWRFALALAGPGGTVIDQGDTWLIQPAA
ncbi:MAG: hypothetical protein ACREJT_13960 [Myxococcota bacterium]